MTTGTAFIVDNGATAGEGPRLLPSRRYAYAEKQYVILTIHRQSNYVSKAILVRCHELGAVGPEDLRAVATLFRITLGDAREQIIAPILRQNLEINEPLRRIRIPESVEPATYLSKHEDLET